MLGLALEQPVPKKVSDKVRVMLILWEAEGDKGGVAKLGEGDRHRGMSVESSSGCPRTSEHERLSLSLSLSLVRVACIL